MSARLVEANTIRGMDSEPTRGRAGVLRSYRLAALVGVALVVCAFFAGAMLVAAGAGAAPTVGPPPVIGIVKTGSTSALRPLDPRTLQPLPGSWSRRVGNDASPIRSPLGTRVAATWNTGTIFVDSRTGSVVARTRTGYHGSDYYTD